MQMMTSTPSVHDHEPANDSPMSCSVSKDYLNENDLPRQYKRGRRRQRTKYSAEVSVCSTELKINEKGTRLKRMRNSHPEQNVKRTLCFERTGRTICKKDSEENKRNSEYIQSNRLKRGKFEKDVDDQDPNEVDKVRCNQLQVAYETNAIRRR